MFCSVHSAFVSYKVTDKTVDLEVHIRPAERPAVRSCVRRAFDAKSLAASESSDPESVSPSTPLTQRRMTSLIKANSTNISNIECRLLVFVMYFEGFGFECEPTYRSFYFRGSTSQYSDFDRVNARLPKAEQTPSVFW